jgi:hypothetical protein
MYAPDPPEVGHPEHTHVCARTHARRLYTYIFICINTCDTVMLRLTRPKSDNQSTLTHANARTRARTHTYTHTHYIYIYIYLSIIDT